MILRHIASLQVFALALLTGMSPIAALAFGPYPPNTTLFVDAANTSGPQSGTASQPYRTLTDALAAAAPGEIIGIAAGDYTGEDSLALVQPVQLVGYDAATTRLHAVEGDDLLEIHSANVRVAELSFVGNWVPVPINDVSDCPASIAIYVPDPSVRIERSDISGNCDGIRIDAYTAGPGPTLSRLDIHGHLNMGINGVADRLSNSLLHDNGAGYRLEKWAPQNTPLVLSAVNNTFIGNGIGIFAVNNLASGEIANNIFVDHAGNGTYAAVSIVGEVLPHFRANLFHANSAVLRRVIVGQPILSYPNVATLNALSGSGGNLAGDPALQSASIARPTAGSPAIDRGLTGGPAVDFDGSFRPVDGNGDCEADWDIGAYEVAPPLVAQVLKIGRCLDWVFVPKSKWLYGGCAVVDCCPNCPGRRILDWEIYAAGPALEAAVLRVEGIAPEALRRVEVQGGARWLTDQALLVPAGRRVVLRGLTFPDRGARSALRMTAETLVASKPTGRDAQRTVNLTQTVGGAVIASARLEY